MKYFNHPSIPFRRLAPLWVLATLLLCSCSKDADPMDDHNNPRPHAPLIIRSTIAAFTRTDSGTQTRTPVEDGTTTRFQSGDKIGLFAVTGIGTSSAAIADGINNTCLTYSPATAGTTPPAGALGEWTPPAGTDLTYNPDATYIAYYPYKDGITIDPKQALATVISSFADMPALQPGTDQSTAELYTASDLMTASGTPTVALTGEMVLKLNFTHSYSLLEVRPLLVNILVAPKDVGFTYHPKASSFIAPSITNIVIQGKKPYEMEPGVFHIIVKSLDGGAVTGYYNADGKVVKYSGKPAEWSDFKPGYMYECEVRTPKPGTNGTTLRPLQPGDFVFQNNNKIEIYPGDGPVDDSGKIPDYSNVVGIVTTCDPTRIAESDKNRGWTHAYVMSTTMDTNKYIWWPNSTDEISEMISFDSSTMYYSYMDGFSDTEKMMGIYDSYPYDNPFSSLFYFRGSYLVPSGINRSDWFVPSSGQCYDLLLNIGKVSNVTMGGSMNNLYALLQKVGKIFPADCIIPSCTLLRYRKVCSIRITTHSSISIGGYDTVDRTAEQFSPVFFFAF